MIQPLDQVFINAREYLRGSLSLAALDAWIMDNLEAFLPADSPGADLALQIQVWVAEMNRGHRDEAEARTLMQGFLNQHEAIILTTAVSPRFTMGNVVYTEQITVGPLVQSSGRRLP